MGVKYMTGYLDPFYQGHLDLIVFKFLHTDEKGENYCASNLLHVVVKEILCNIHYKKQFENVICSMQVRHLFIKVLNM